MLDLLFGIHIGGWQATFQFAFWTSIALFIVLRWMKRNEQ